MKRYSFTMIIILILISTFLVSCSRTVEIENSNETNVNYEALIDNGLVSDLKKIRGILNESILSTDYDKSKLNELILKVENKEVDREYAVHTLQEIISDCECAHFGIYTLMDDELYFNILPIMFIRSGDDYFVTNTSEEYKEYQKNKLIEIAGLSVDEAVEKLGSLLNAETETGKKYVLENLLYETELRWLDMVDENSQVHVKLEDEQGNINELEISFVDSREIAVLRLLQEDELPSIYQARINGINYSFTGEPENGLMFFQYISCVELDDETVGECVERMISELRNNDSYKTIVFDVRLNNGGNRFLLAEALYNNRDFFNNYNIIVLNSGQTYSAAMQLSEDCLELYDNVIIYGEETGQRINNKTEITRYTFDNLHCGMYIPSKLDSLIELEKRAEDVNKGVMPDIFVTEQFADYLQGEDTCYKLIRENSK